MSYDPDFSDIERRHDEPPDEPYPRYIEDEAEDEPIEDEDDG